MHVLNHVKILKAKIYVILLLKPAIGRILWTALNFSVTFSKRNLALKQGTEMWQESQFDPQILSKNYKPRSHVESW